MKVEIESTTKIVQLNGVPARIWEGQTESGIFVHCYITRIAINEDEPESNAKIFEEELIECKPPSAKIEAIPTSMIL